MFESGLRRAGTRRFHLLEHAAWCGIWGPLLTRICFGVGRVGQARCRGRRPPRRWYIDVSDRRTSTSVATFICWIGLLTGIGRFFRGSHISYDPVSVPHLWFVTIRGSAPGLRWLFVICYVTGGLFVIVLHPRNVIDLYILLYCIRVMLLIYIYLMYIVYST
jgi:hypothetical protein